MKKQKKEVQPNWHPNFRLADDLPDIKIIRTDFLINGGPGVLCALLLVVFVQGEIVRGGTRGEISKLQQKIQAEQGQNDAIVVQSQQFVQEGAKLVEVEAFYKTPVVPDALLLTLVEIKPENLIFKNVTYREAQVQDRRGLVTNYDLIITGETRDLVHLDKLKASLAGLDFVKAYQGTVNETIFSRNELTGVFPFQVDVKMAPTK